MSRIKSQGRALTCKAYYLRHRDKILKERRLRYKKNRLKELNQAKEYQIRKKRGFYKTSKETIYDKPWYRFLFYAKERCFNPNNPSYKYYGGKGIKMLLTAEDVSMLWERDRAEFLEYPSLDRKNSDGDYTLDNCQFIEMNENSKKSCSWRKVKEIQCPHCTAMIAI